MDESGDLALLVAADIPCLDGQFSYIPTAAGDQLPLISVQQEQTLQDLSVEHTPAAEASLPIPEREFVPRRTNRTTAGHHSNPYKLPCTLPERSTGDEHRGAQVTVSSHNAVFRPWL